MPVDVGTEFLLLVGSELGNARAAPIRASVSVYFLGHLGEKNPREEDQEVQSVYK